MDIVLNVVAPVFAIILAGWTAGRVGLLGRDGSVALNQFVYWFALPPVLFLGLAGAPLEDIFNAAFLNAFLIGLGATYLIGLASGWALWRRRHHRRAHGLTNATGASAAGVRADGTNASADDAIDPGTTGQKASIMALNASFSNTGYMGIPLFIALVGSQLLAPVIVATVIMSAVMVAVAIIMLEGLGQSDEPPLMIARNIGRALITNPLIISSLAGLAAAFVALPIAEPVERFGNLIGAAAGPCALFSIGLFLAGQSLRDGLGDALWISVLKLVVQPAITILLIDLYFPMDPYWRASAIVLAALPTGGLTFVIAERYGISVGDTSATILISTLLSLFTLSGILLFLAPVFQQAANG
ncbi:MAG: AEC family transporter [Pseudomonadota bacterium]